MHHFIAVAGVLASGKSTVSKVLASGLECELFCENVVRAEFLPLFYNDPKRWAFAAQTWYLTERSHQADTIKRRLGYTSVVQDSPLFEDYRTYSKAQYELGNMTRAEYALYERLYHLIAHDTPSPDLIIQLDASLPSIQKRIASRGRAYEQKIEESYLEVLSRLQDEWIASIPAANLLRVDIDSHDFVEKEDDRTNLVKLVRERISTL